MTAEGLLDYLEESVDLNNGVFETREEIFDVLDAHDVDFSDPQTFDFEIVGPNTDNEIEFVFDVPADTEIMDEVLNGEHADGVLEFDLIRGDDTHTIPWKVTKITENSMIVEL